jgi:hypothetical protein
MFLFDMIKSWFITIAIIIGVAYASGVQMPWLDQYVQGAKVVMTNLTGNIENKINELFPNSQNFFDSIKKSGVVPPSSNPDSGKE